MARYLLRNLREGMSANVIVLSCHVHHRISAANDVDVPTTARDKFGGQRAISSDQYFGRGTYDPVATSEAQNRLQNFQGASSISSNQYFGREEEEEMGGMGGPDGGLLGDGTLAGFEVAARDAVQRVLANPDVQTAADNIRAGAMKVCLSHIIYEILIS